MTRILRFSWRSEDRLGVDLGEHIVDVAAASAASGDPHPLSSDALAFFEGGDTTLEALHRAVDHAISLPTKAALTAGLLLPSADARRLVPIPNPRKIICVARNFGRHAEEAGLKVSAIPILFARFAATLVADGDFIEMPTVSEQLDWEGELAVVIGRGGRSIPRKEAFGHVAGYTIFNDVTVRDYQFRVSQYTAGKNFARSAPMGPTIVLADESFNPHDARITTTVNRVVKQDASTADFIYDIPTILEHISEFIELEPGDVIPMGTPAGVGFARRPPEFLRIGDVVEVAIEGLGVLRNHVAAMGSVPLAVQS